MKKMIKRTLLFIFAAWLIVTVGGIIIVMVSPKTSTPPPAPVATIQAPVKIDASTLPVYTVEQIALDYMNNSIAADQKYKGKRFVIRGNVQTVSSSFLGDPYIELTGASRYAIFQLLFDKSRLNELASVKANTMIKSSCEGTGETLGFLIAKECEIL